MNALMKLTSTIFTEVGLGVEWVGSYLQEIGGKLWDAAHEEEVLTGVVEEFNGTEWVIKP